MYRVVFPLQLKLSNTTADAEGADSMYGLAGVVVHVGSGPTHGESARAGGGAKDTPFTLGESAAGEVR